ncbi:MAG: SMC family ATPase [Caldilineaceae bacterium]|nr:SMC family ATPase [Caldilineaceae bacterium]MDE0340424.1 SMC family ATPase [Caldilineaceae bacterium]
MLIRSLTLENVKSYARATVEFSPGTNAVVGPNGAGKTTILEAIGFALFDHLPYSRPDFVRASQKTARVAVDYLSDFDERAYRVVRSCGANSAYTVMDPELDMKICEGKADVMQFLRLHLGIDEDTEPEDLFRNAVGVPQGSFTVSFLETPRIRKAVFDPLLKVAEYRRAWERLREPLSLLNQRQGTLAVEVGRLGGELKRLPTVRAEAGEMTAQIKSGETELRAAQAELAAAESARKAMEVKRERVQELRRMAQLHEQEAAEQERTLATARQRLTESERATTILEANRTGYEAYRAAQKAQGAVNERLAQRRRLEEERAGVQTLLARAETQADAQERALVEIAEAEKTAANLANAAAEQEKLESELRDAQRQADQLKDAEARVQREQTAVNAAQARLDTLRKELAQAQEIEASLEPLQAHLETLQQSKSAEQATEARMHAEQETIQEQGQQLRASETSPICPICEQPLSTEHRERLLQRLRKRWVELTEASQAVAEAVQKAEVELVQTRATLSQQMRALRALPRQNAVETADSELADLKSQLTEASETVEALSMAPQRLGRLQEALKTLGDPRRRRDAAIQQAQRRGRVEEALQLQQAQVSQKRDALAELDERLAEFADLDAETAQISSRLRKFQTADDLYRRNQAAAEALSQRQDEVAVAEKALEAAQVRYEDGQEQLAASSREFDEEHFQEAEAQVDEFRGRSARLAADLAQWRERLFRAEEEIAQLQTLEKRLATAQSRRDRLVEQEKLLQFLRSVIQEAGPFLTKALVQQISYSANQLFGQIMEDYTRTLRWEEDYGIILEVDGRERTFSQLSGGEQMSAALAVRLALLQEMSSIGVAFFDEPTTNLDETRRGALARQIVGVHGFEQLFIISHDDSFEQATEKLIRVEKRNGTSEIHYE